jgi:hypothetical protein
MTLSFPCSKHINLYIHTTNSHIYIPIPKHHYIYCILHGFLFVNFLILHFVWFTCMSWKSLKFSDDFFTIFQASSIKLLQVSHLISLIRIYLFYFTIVVNIICYQRFGPCGASHLHILVWNIGIDKLFTTMSMIVTTGTSLESPSNLNN